MKRLRAFTLLELMIAMTLIAILAAILIPNFLRARSKSHFEACHSNLKNIATALEIYSSENYGHYPGNFTTLVPNYLKAIPTCPAISAPSYTSSYSVSTQPDIFTIYCQSAGHVPVNIQPNYPQYSSCCGLIDR